MRRSDGGRGGSTVETTPSCQSYLLTNMRRLLKDPDLSLWIAMVFSGSMKVFYLSWNGSIHCQQNKFAVMMMLLVRQELVSRAYLLTCMVPLQENLPAVYIVDCRVNG